MHSLQRIRISGSVFVLLNAAACCSCLSGGVFFSHGQEGLTVAVVSHHLHLLQFSGSILLNSPPPAWTFPPFVAWLWISHTEKLGLISIPQDLFPVAVTSANVTLEGRAVIAQRFCAHRMLQTLNHDISVRSEMPK